MGIGVMAIALVAMMGFSIYSQRKRTKQIEAMRSSMQVGDKIITIGGQVGTIKYMDDIEFILETEDETVIRYRRWAIQSKIEPVNPAQ